MTSILILSALLVSQVEVKAPSFTPERIAMYATAITDVTTTILALRNGATEANPVIGKNFSVKKLVIIKLSAILVLEVHAYLLKKYKLYGKMRFNYLVPAYIWGLASAFNLHGVFK